MTTDHQISTPKSEHDRITRAFQLLTGGDEVRLCKDIPEDACKDQPGNFFRHLLASVGSKLSDEVASARLVLPWLLAHLGGGGAAVAWLLPIREAGTLVPQLLIAAWLRHLALRKYAWAFGGFVQGLAALGMAAIALLGSGPASTWGVLGLLLLLALGRGISSIATKDVLGKTIDRSRRGALMGWSESASSVIALLIGLLLPFLGKSPERGLLALLLLVAVAGWWINAAVALAIREEPGATEGNSNAGRAMLEGFGLLFTDRVFLRFNLTRGLLLGSVLSLPYLVVLARKQSGADMSSLGPLVRSLQQQRHGRWWSTGWTGYRYGPGRSTPVWRLGAIDLELRPAVRCSGCRTYRYPDWSQDLGGGFWRSQSGHVCCHVKYPGRRTDTYCRCLNQLCCPPLGRFRRTGTDDGHGSYRGGDYCLVC